MKPPTKILLFLFAFMLSFCNTANHNSNISVDKYKWEIADFENYFNTEDSTLLISSVKKGIFRPNQDCHGTIIISTNDYPKNIKHELAEIQKQETTLKRIIHSISLLYQTIPQFYIDTGITYNFDYEISNKNFLSLLTKATRGEVAALCNNYASFSEALWRYVFPNDKDVKIMTVSMSVPEYNVSHTFNIFQFLENEIQYRIIVDAMYGYIFPVKNGVIIPLESILNTDNLPEMIHYVNQETLSNKRFLTNKIWPCNIVQENITQYFLALPGALAKYELREPEKIEFLFPENYTIENYTLDLINILHFERKNIDN